MVNPPSWQPSFPVKPGQTVWVTLRIRGINGVAGEQLARRAGLWVRSQPDTVANNAMDEAKDGEIDRTAPSFSTSPGQVLGTGEATGPGGGVVTYTLPVATDAVDAAPVVTCAPVSGSNFPLGESTVNCTATDASLNSTSAAFKVVVVDTTPPMFPTAGSDLAAPTKATGRNGAAVHYTMPTATDIVDAAADGVVHAGVWIDVPHRDDAGHVYGEGRDRQRFAAGVVHGDGDQQRADLHAAGQHHRAGDERRGSGGDVHRHRQ